MLYIFLFPFRQSGVELELVECQPLLEWLANNYKSFGATLEIITDKSQEGSQFVRGFGGIGGELFLYTLVITAYSLTKQVLSLSLCLSLDIHMYKHYILNN